MSNAVALILACCRIHSPTVDGSCSEQFSSIDWAQFLKLVYEHKLALAVVQNLERVFPEPIPDWVINSLQLHRKKTASRMLGLAAELTRLMELFSREGIVALSFKGPLLSLELFGDVAARESHDIDILINPSDMERVDRLMSELGYESTLPRSEHLSFKQNKFLKHWAKDRVYLCPRKKICVEIHWKLLDFPRLLRVGPEEIWDRAEQTVFCGTSILRLDQELNLLYLCAHGAIHGWKRLFWVFDIAMILQRQGDKFDWCRLVENASAWGTKRCLIEAVVLAHEFFLSPLPEAIKQEFQNDRTARRLVQTTISKSKTWQEYSFVEQMVNTHHALKLNQNTRYKLQVLLPFLRPRAEDWGMLPLPDVLFELYYVLRPFTLAYRHSKLFFTHFFDNGRANQRN